MLRFHVTSAFSEDGKRRNRTTDPVKLSSSGFKLQTECLFYVYHICHCVRQNVFSFLFHCGYHCQALFNVGCFTEEIARVYRGYYQSSRENRRCHHSICLPNSIDGDNYTAMFAANRVNFPWWSSGPLHVLLVNSLARQNAAVEFSINNVTGKLRRKTGGRCRYTRNIENVGHANSCSTFTPRAHNLASALLRSATHEHCAFEIRVNVTSICK